MSVYLDNRGNSVLSVAICDRCNRKFAYVDLMPDPNFPGMRVCKEDKDNFDPWRLPALQTENIALRFPRPDQNVAIGPVGGNQLVTNGNPNEPQQYDSFFIDGTPYGIAGAPGDISLNGGVDPLIVAQYPTITAVSPNNGPQAGGTLVLISGTNLNNVIAVKFGGELAPFTIISPIQISAISPAYPSQGLVDVSVSSSLATATYHGAFTYN